MEHLLKTTYNFDHMVYLNGVDNFYIESQIIEVNSSPQISPQNGHIRGLNFIVNYFNNHPEYDTLLLLDNDCFPFQKNWQDKLSKIGNFKVAAAVRFENLDTFAHPCIFYVKKPAALTLKFDNFPQTNILGHQFNDVGSNVEKFFPLIRTNRINYHPILCGIYWDCFYHHGAGSRSTEFRVFHYQYLNQSSDIKSKEIKLFNRLIKNPNLFIAQLQEKKSFNITIL
jgi:hypothetical protein